MSELITEKTRIRIASMKMTVYCLCGERLRVTGTMDGCKTAIRLWAQGHKGQGHKAMTGAEWRKLQSDKKREAKRKAQPAPLFPKEQLVMEL